MPSIKKVLGIPRADQEEQAKHEVVKTPEFDLTQFAKALVPAAVVVLGGIVAGLEELGVKEAKEPVVLVGALAVVAAAVLAMSFVAAVDIAARAFLSGEGSASRQEEEGQGEEDVPADGDALPLIPAPAGMQVKLRDDAQPRPVLALSGDGKKVSSYLVSGGSSVTWEAGDKQVKAFDSAPKWHSAEEVDGIRTSAWP